MRIRWLSTSERDLVRLYDFLKEVSPRAAVRGLKGLHAGIRKLSDHPRIGSALDNYEPREVRALIVDTYEVRYEIVEATIVILRIWHVREER